MAPHFLCHPACPMSVPSDAYSRFQEELSALEGKKPAPQNLTRAQKLELAKAEFLTLKRKYGLTVADAVAFFPEEDGIAYLQNLIVEVQSKPIRKSKAKPD
jgi:hypothetical protein